jgi:hypothetical protein
MAGIGPFPSFVFPGPYTQTLNEAPRVTATGGLRVPAFIGVADEVIPVTAYEMIRGSSSMADNRIVKEEISGTIDGINRSFQVSYYPITTGAGTGTTTTNTNDVLVYVNGEKVPVATVAGSAGTVTLVTAPITGDTVEISYYYKFTDTLRSSENQSDQADGTNTTFKTDYVPIVNGDNGGTITTDPTKVIVKLNGSASGVTISAVDGVDGLVTVTKTDGSAIPAGSLVQITYYSNEYQNTADILPSHNVTEITRVGLSTSTTDFYNGTDYVLDTTGSFDTINWGNSYKISSGTNTSGYEYFDDSQIAVTLYDNRIFRRECTGTVDGTNKTFVIPSVPTTGTGEDRLTDDPSLLTAYHGTAAFDATSVAIVEMSGASKTITLATAPVVGETVYVTQYQNMLSDDVWTLTDTTTGVTGTGTYTLSGEDSGVGMDIEWSALDSSVNPSVNALGNTGIQYPAGIGAGNRDTQVLPGYGVEETITLTFQDANTYVVSSDNPSGTGSGTDNTGYLNQTYIDTITAFRVTLVTPSAGAYLAGDYIGYKVSSEFVTSTAVPTRAIPGARVTVSDTVDINVGDTGIITTYNKSGSEPNIGDFYYVTFNDGKSFDADGLIDPVFVTTEKNALAYTGPLGVNNKLALAAHLSFLNGAPGVILLQIQKTTGGEDAPDSRYIDGIDVFNLPMEGGLRPALMEPVTTSAAVLSYTKTSNTIQSSIRYANERMTYFGFEINTSPTEAMAIAQSYGNERMTGLYPDGAVVTLTDELGNNTEFLVNGSFLAAAITGRDTSPAYDVAEPLTRKPVVGFTRLYRRMDSVTQSQVANAGVTILEEQPAGIIVKMDLTTDVTSVLTRTPSVIRIKDFVQQGIRNALMPYIGMKFLNSRTTEIVTTVKSYLSALVKAQIITAFTGVTAIPDPVDPTTIQVNASYSPVLPLLWIVVTFNLRTRL